MSQETQYNYIDADGNHFVAFEVVEGLTEISSKPSDFHEWSGSAWVENTPAKLNSLTNEMRVKRNNLLIIEVDPIVSNSLRWAEMTSEKQTEWADYRTALLNLPEQEGFPLDITWPTKPE
jgi:hypothetical protein